MLSMFWKKKNIIQKKTIDINVNEQGKLWVINEELKRVHGLLIHAGKNNSGLNTADNMSIFWNKIVDLQKEMIILINKMPDEDIKKSVLEIQNHIVDQELLSEEKQTP